MRKVLGDVARAESPQGPLVGTLVLDLGQTAVGPVSAMYLAHLGATVIKVEPPRGELGRFDVSRKHGAGLTFLSTNLGKYGVVLDFKNPTDHAYALALVSRADVVIDNFRSFDVMRRLGLDYFDTLKPLNPGLVYLQSASFQGRVPFREFTSFEWIAQALSGFAGATRSADGRPEFSRGTAYLDWSGAMVNVIAVLAGLHHRRISGKGVLLSTSQFGTSVFTGASRLAALAADRPDASGVDHHFGPDMLDRAFATADGYIAMCAPTPAVWRRLLDAIGVPADTRCDPTGVALEPVMKARLTSEWLQRLRAARVPVGVARSGPSLVDELRSEPQVWAEGLVQEHDPGRGGVLYPAPPWQIVDAATVEPRPAPELGEHDELVKCIVEPVAFAGEHDADRPSYGMSRLGGVKPLAGVRVVELGSGLAAGTAGMILAGLGASVVKVLPPWGDVALAPATEAEVVERQLHSAKTIERLDLADGLDRDRLDVLVRETDAVIVAGPMRFRRAFRLDDGDLRAVRNDVVFCGLTGFGRNGPLADSPATEFDVQVMSGMTRQLGCRGEMPIRQGFDVVSANTGYAAAQAVMAALLGSGSGPTAGRHFEVSLLRTAVALNGWNLTAESGGDGVVGKQVQAANWPPDHGYRCKDRQVLVSIRNNEEGWVKFLVALDRVDLLADERFNTLEHLRANEWRLPGLLAENTCRFTSEELRSIVAESDGELVPVLEPREVPSHPQSVVQNLVRPDGIFDIPIDVVAR